MPRKPSETVQLKLRFPERLRVRIEAEAEKSERSMNAEIVHRLEQSFEGDSRAEVVDALHSRHPLPAGLPCRLVMLEPDRVVLDGDHRRQHRPWPAPIDSPGEGYPPPGRVHFSSGPTCGADRCFERIGDQLRVPVDDPVRRQRAGVVVSSNGR